MFAQKTRRTQKIAREGFFFMKYFYLAYVEAMQQ